jgi:Mn-dependent DtxR family transcriptional regulator
MVVRSKNLSEQILEIFKRKTNRPVSTTDIANELKVSWHSIQVRCLKLQIDGYVIGFRIGKMNLWIANPNKKREDGKRNL